MSAAIIGPGSGWPERAPRSAKAFLLARASLRSVRAAIRSTGMASTRQRWLFGPLPDLLLGCGGALALALLGLAVLGPAAPGRLPGFVIPLLLTVVVSPHFGATLLRVFETAESRREYRGAALGTTAAMASLFVAGVYQPRLVPWLFTAYLSLSPWHYSAQNFGLSMMFLRRRGVEVSATARRLWSATFLGSFGVTLLVMHEGNGSPTLVEGITEGAPFLALGVPSSVVSVGLVLLGGGSVLALAAAVVAAARRGQGRELGPAVALALTQMLWFTIPLGLRHLRMDAGVLSWQHRGTVFVFIALAHSVQYLWVSSYFARRQTTWRGTGRYLGKTLAAGVALTTWPVLLFAPSFLGGASYGEAILWLLPAVVNLHHYLLDGVIWKLRRSSVATVLVRSPPGPAGDERPAVRRPAGRAARLAWSLAALALVVQSFVFWTAYVAYPRALERSDHGAAHRALRRLSWLGYDPPTPDRSGDRRSAASRRSP